MGWTGELIAPQVNNSWGEKDVSQFSMLAHYAKKKAFGTDGLVGRDYGNSSISFLWPDAMCLIYIDDIHSLTQLWESSPQSWSFPKWNFTVKGRLQRYF